jgi:hypothetical protein
VSEWKDSQELLDVIDKLQGTPGMPADIKDNLPQVIVVGAQVLLRAVVHSHSPSSQGTGKSSVLTAISGIELPRGEQTTTRCPIRLVLRRATCQFRAVISVKWAAQCE